MTKPRIARVLTETALALLCIVGADAAVAAKTVIPHHHRLQVPLGGTTPADVAAAVKAAKLPVSVLIPELGKSYDLAR